MVAIGDVRVAPTAATLWAQLPRDGRVISSATSSNAGAVAESLRFCARPGRARRAAQQSRLQLSRSTPASGRPTTTTRSRHLSAPDRAHLIDWLRARRSAHEEHGALLSTPRVAAMECRADTRVRARSEQRLQRADYRDFLARMYGNQPARWNDRCAAMNRLRWHRQRTDACAFVAGDGTMDSRSRKGAAAGPRDSCRGLSMRSAHAAQPRSCSAFGRPWVSLTAENTICLRHRLRLGGQ